MPTYEYACRQCGHRLDVVQKFSDDPLTTCPECSGELRKVYGAVGIVLKGSGFYKTDSRASSSKSVGSTTKETKDTSSASDSSSSGSSGSADSSSSTASNSPKESKTPASTGS